MPNEQDPLRPETDALQVKLSLPDVDHASQMAAVRNALLAKGASFKPRYLGDKDRLTPEAHRLIVAAIERGATLNVACKLARIDPKSVRKWFRAVDNGGIDETTGFKVTGSHYQFYRDVMLAEATNEQRAIEKIQELGYGGVEKETDVVETVTTNPDGSVSKVRAAKKEITSPSLSALTWFVERRHRDWHGKRQVQPGMDGVNKDNASPVTEEGYEDSSTNNMPPLVIQVSNSATSNMANIPASASAPGAQGLPKAVPRDMQFHGLGRISKHPLNGESAGNAGNSPSPAVPGAGLYDRVVDPALNITMKGTASDGYLEVDNSNRDNPRDNSHDNPHDNPRDSASGQARQGLDASIYKGEEKGEAQESPVKPRTTADIIQDLIKKREQDKLKGK